MNQQGVDASAKVPSGILGANINWVGSHQQCNNIKNLSVAPIIESKYCRFEFDLQGLTVWVNDWNIIYRCGKRQGPKYAFYLFELKKIY